MEHIELVDYFRILTALLGLMALYRSSYHAFLLWESYTQRLKELHWVQCALLLLVIETSIEAMLADARLTPRTVLSFFCAVLCLRAEFRNEGFFKFEDDLIKVKHREKTKDA